MVTIQAVNTIRPPYIKYTQKSRPLVPVDTPLSIIRKHIPRQYDIDKIVKSIETHVIHGLELPIQAQDLIKAYQTSVHFQDIYHYITDRKLPSGSKAQNCIHAEALNYLVVNNFLFRIDTCVRCNLTVHRSVTPSVIWQPIWRPHLLKRVY